MKNKVVTGISRMTPDQKIVFGEGLENGLTNNPLIPNAAAMITLIHDKTEALRIARGKAVQTHARADYAAATDAEIDFDLAVQTVSMFVQRAADTDPNHATQIIVSSGFRTRKRPEPKQPPGDIEKIEAKFTGQPGTVLLFWKNAKFARYYDVYMSTNPNGEWALIDSIEGRKMLVETLATGTKYYFRVIARNRAGKSGYSDIASQLAA